MKMAGLFAAVGLTLAVQTTIVPFVMPTARAPDLGLVLVVYVALISGPLTGLLVGTGVGLVQDALATGLVGIGSLAKTIVGFLTGVVGTHFIVAQPLSRLIVFFASTLIHEAIVLGVSWALDPKAFDWPYATVLSRGALNAVAGVVAFQVAGLVTKTVDRRAVGRNGLRVTRRLGE